MKPTWKRSWSYTTCQNTTPVKVTLALAAEKIPNCMCSFKCHGFKRVLSSAALVGTYLGRYAIVMVPGDEFIQVAALAQLH